MEVQAEQHEVWRMSGRQVAWTTAAATGLGCALVAAAAAWLLLTEPLALTSAADTRFPGGLLQALVAALEHAAVAIMRLL
jgi:hypothetical protein